MKNSAIICLVWVIFLLQGCMSSKEPRLYILNPIPVATGITKAYSNVQIAIDKVNLPAYLEKPQLSIYCTKHRIILKENDQWAEGLDKNITRVIETNLSSLLPNVIINSSSWDSLFKPTYHLGITIRQFTADCQGNSLLQADYIIYHNEKLIGKYDVYYTNKTSKITIENLVITMNYNITRLTKAIAYTLVKHAYS